MNEDRIERARRALGADRAVPLGTGAAKGPLDLLQQAAEVARIRDVREIDREGVIVLSTAPVVLAAASLTQASIPLVRPESA